MWFGYASNRIATVVDGKGTLLGAADGVNVGTVSLISQIDGQLWMGGDLGLEHLKGGRF